MACIQSPPMSRLGSISNQHGASNKNRNDGYMFMQSYGANQANPNEENNIIG